MGLLKPLSIEQTNVLLKHLLSAENAHQNATLTIREGSKVNCFHPVGIIRVLGDQHVMCRGYVCGPDVAENVKYDVEFEKDKPINIYIRSKVKDMSAALDLIQEHIAMMSGKYKVKRSGGNGKYMRGFVLAAGPITETGKARFALAESRGLIPSDFKDTCEQIRITMRKYKD